MEKFTRIPTDFPEVSIIEPRVFGDNRGFFLESYNEREFGKIGIDTAFVQDNHSCSRRGVIRGLHFQSPHPQEKLVRVIAGSVFDVVVDIRKGSPDFGRSIGVVLSAAHHRMIHVPPGFAHGFLALEDATHLLYKTSDFYYPECDAGIFWNDPDIGIPWPVEGLQPVVSGKDRALPLLKDMSSPFEYMGGVE